jgi:quercetin dioxygenase-like cupin family protein
MLTNSIPSGKINAQLITLSPNEGNAIKLHTHVGDESALVVEGSVHFSVNGSVHELGAGDSIYYVAEQEHGYGNASNAAEAKMIWFASERRID